MFDYTNKQSSSDFIRRFHGKLLFDSFNEIIFGLKPRMDLQLFPNIENSLYFIEKSKHARLRFCVSKIKADHKRGKKFETYCAVL